MVPLVAATNRVHCFMSDLTSRIVAETGIPSDRYHLGKVILQSLKDAPDFVLQIDAATDKSETFKSALERSVRCAESLKKMGLKCGDVMAIIAPHYLEVAILYYSALYLGIKIATMDSSFEILEFQEILQVNRPNIIFSQSNKIPVIKEAMKQIDLKSKIVSLDDGSNGMSFANFIDQCGDVDVYAFKPTDFDPEDTTATLLASSGTTGLPKVVVSTHKNYLSSLSYMWENAPKMPTAIEKCFLISPIQWTSAVVTTISAPIFRYTQIHISAPYTSELFIDAINKYRPDNTALSPTSLLSIIKPGLKKQADMTCFKVIYVGGNTLPKELLQRLKNLAPNTIIVEGYRATETVSHIFNALHATPGSLGRPIGCYDYRLVDPATLKNIYEPHVNGELWIRGDGVAKGYYKNPAETKAAFLEDGWFRTGDLFYRDEHYSFFYVDRLKLLLKYRAYPISPAEIEKVIRQHPGVLDVVVTSIPDLECGDLPVAYVVANPDCQPTAQEIKDLVKEKLSDAKQLRGGVIFLDEFPLTSTAKVDRIKLKALAVTAKRE